MEASYTCASHGLGLVPFVLSSWPVRSFRFALSQLQNYPEQLFALLHQGKSPLLLNTNNRRVSHALLVTPSSTLPNHVILVELPYTRYAANAEPL